MSMLVQALHPGALRAELQFRQPRVDVGNVKCGAPLAHDFAFRNAAMQPVEIIDIQASCGCLKPRLEARTMQPGASGSLHVEINTLTQSAGPHTWEVHVRYRLGEDIHEAALQLVGNIITEIYVEPCSLTIHAGRAISHELRLTDMRPHALSITAVRCTSPKIAARVENESRDAAGHVIRTIRFTVADDILEGRHEEMLTIFTDDPTYRDLNVPVTVIKRPRQRVTAMPAEAAMLAQPGQPLPSRIVLLRDSQNETVDIEQITTSDPAIICTWAHGPGSHATLRIRVDGSRLKDEGLKGSVEVHIRKPAAETVVIPVTVNVPKDQRVNTALKGFLITDAIRVRHILAVGWDRVIAVLFVQRDCFRLARPGLET
jgi:hypothetical protein